MTYEILDTRLVQEDRGQNISPFYFTQYVDVKFEGYGEIITFKFYDLSDEDIKVEIEKYVF
jgi:hypothetical protein